MSRYILSARPENPCEKKKEGNLQISSLFKVCAISSSTHSLDFIPMVIDTENVILILSTFCNLLCYMDDHKKLKLEQHIVHFITNDSCLFHRQ